MSVSADTTEDTMIVGIGSVKEECGVGVGIDRERGVAC